MTSIQKRYSTIDNISITSDNVTFDVTAGDTFIIDKISYSNNERYDDSKEEIDILEHAVRAVGKDCVEITLSSE